MLRGKGSERGIGRKGLIAHSLEMGQIVVLSQHIAIWFQADNAIEHGQHQETCTLWKRSKFSVGAGATNVQ